MTRSRIRAAGALGALARLCPYIMRNPCFWPCPGFRSWPLSRDSGASLSCSMSPIFPPIPNLIDHLRALLDQIPAGRVSTYGDLAEALGSRLAARWVGHYMAHHTHRVGCPCHRVVQGEGKLGLYVTGDPAEKARCLKAEGVVVAGESVDLSRFGWPASRFRSERPLERLEQFQAALTAKVSLRGRKRLPSQVGGVDVSYGTDIEAAAAYVLVDLATGRLRWSLTLRRPVQFPYISTFLAFRELPILLELLAMVRAQGRLAPLVLVDGSGILHPRGAGIASHLGVTAGIATVGVTKRLLCGQVDCRGLEPLQWRDVLCEGRRRGAVIRPTTGSRRLLFVSPGHRVSLPIAKQLVRAVLRGRRLPEPLYWADRLSRSALREPWPSRIPPKTEAG